jgi:superfamily II DNA or RNA helicase
MIIRDKIYIPVSRLGSKVNDLARLFTYQNPEYFQKSRMGFSVSRCSPFLTHYAFTTINNEKFIVLPRGAIKKVMTFLNKNGIPLRYLDERVTHPEIDVQLKDTTLEKQQLDIIDILETNEGGLIEMAPGGGKTIAALGFIAKLKQPTLILVHEHRLRTQWEGEVQRRLGGTFTLGRYDGDKKQEGDIVIGIINTAYNMYKEDREFFSKFGIVIIDEVHHLPAHMFTLVVNNIPAKYRIGLTGTVKRKDGKEVLLFDILGEILTSIDPEQLRHRITNFEFEMISTDVNGQVPTRRMWVDGIMTHKIDYVKLLSFLVGNKERNTLILEKVVESLELGHKPLILSDRVEHCKYLHSYLTDLGYNTILLIGATRKSTNWEDVRQDDSVQAIVAQRSIAEEGLDYPSLSAIHLTCPSTNLPKIKQRIGRIRRVSSDKLTPKVYDYVDNAISMTDTKGNTFYPLKRSSKSRESFYRKLQQEYSQTK